MTKKLPTTLTFRGTESSYISGVPARDLDQHALERLAYVRELATTGVRPEVPSPVLVAEITTELLATGLYVAGSPDATTEARS